MAAFASGIAIAGAGLANSVYQGNKAAGAAKDAALLQSDAATNAAEMNAAAQEQFRTDLAPYRQAGETALPILQGMATAGPVDRVAQLESSPLFQASLNARDRSTLGAAATQGRIGTGDFSQQIGENYLLAASPLIAQQMEEERRKEQQLLNLANIGQSSAAQVGASGLNAANVQGANLMGAADANSAGIVAGQQANANRNAEILNNLPSLINSFTGGGA